jgi:SHS2 domain-containing protein
MPQFETLDISGDAGIRAFGDDPKELFINAALGMYSLITDAEAVKERRAIEIFLESNTLEGLLISWLNELIFHFDTYGFIGKKIAITEFVPREDKPAGGQFAVRAFVSGEEFDPLRHQGKLLIKAATYHKLRVQRTGETWETQIIFDI